VVSNRYLPGSPNAASDRSINFGSGTPTDTVNSRHILSNASIGSPVAPPSTAAVTAPIEIPVTATGVNPGRFSYSAFSTPYSCAPSAPPPCSTIAV